jgi:SAM-dependent methyltransferase
MRSLGSYGRLCTEFYDLDKPEAPPDALEFYWRLYVAEGGPALEVMCGSGRFLLPFAACGAHIDGVDASPRMLQACRRKLSERGFEAALYEQFVEDLDLPRRYRYAFVPGGSFVLIEAGSQVDVLQRIAAHLEPGGLLAVELHTPVEPNYFDSTPQVRRVTRPDGAEIVLTAERGLYRYDLVKDGAVLRSETETYGWHPRGRSAFTAKLQDGGFGEVRAVKPYTDAPADDADGLIVYLARRL